MTLCIIPARGGSKGVVGKNLRNVAGIPLVARTILAAKQAEFRAVVSTDSSAIARVAEAYGATVVFRPDSLAGDNATSEEAIIHALDNTPKDPDDVIVFAQCTSPFTTAEDMHECYCKARDMGSGMTVVEFSSPVWRCAVGGHAESVNHDQHNRPMRQNWQAQYRETGGVYAVDEKEFRNHHSRFGNGITWLGQLVVVPQWRGVDIDTEDDLVVANALARHHCLNNGLDIQPMLRGINVLVCDFDGVMTDNTVWTNDKGRESVRCSKSDSTGIMRASHAGLDVIVLTHEMSKSVVKRCKKLDINCIQTQRPKIELLNELVEVGDDLQWIAYIGNDTADLECMRACSVSFAPNDAEQDAYETATIRLGRSGGNGCVREAIDLLLRARDQR